MLVHGPEPSPAFAYATLSAGIARTSNFLQVIIGLKCPSHAVRDTPPHARDLRKTLISV